MSLLDLEDHADVDPIDTAQSVAEARDWAFDRIDEAQIALAVEGAWRTYALTLAWSPAEATLRLVLTYEMELPGDRRGALLDLLNRVNDKTWSGAFTHWPEEDLIVWRAGQHFAGTDGPAPAQVDAMIAAAVAAAERFYPAFQLVAFGETEPHMALHAAIAEAYGTA